MKLDLIFVFLFAIHLMGCKDHNEAKIIQFGLPSEQSDKENQDNNIAQPREDNKKNQQNSQSSIYCSLLTQEECKQCLNAIRYYNYYNQNFNFMNCLFPKIENRHSDLIINMEEARLGLKYQSGSCAVPLNAEFASSEALQYILKDKKCQTVDHKP
ncbi:hypothetical protein [Caedibacter taeniospiralis]|uniref:hypothetical protein n=1 Tax=Caedibacter taeniospiralis TaxID=28907 RepID=UPI00130214EA|nr:hypothetical protein [Caedibacter taeniospiralis]